MTTITEEGALHQLLRSLPPKLIREVETPQPAILPNGTRVRGIALGNGAYLTRDRTFYFYLEAPGGQVLRGVMTPGELLAVRTLDEVREAVRSALQARSALYSRRARSLVLAASRL